VSPLPVFYSNDQVAEAWNVSVWTVRRWVRAGKATPARLPSGKYRWDDRNLRQLEAAFQPPPTAAAQRRRKKRTA